MGHSEMKGIAETQGEDEEGGTSTMWQVSGLKQEVRLWVSCGVIGAP